jgi:hypothetical protein
MNVIVGTSLPKRLSKLVGKLNPQRDQEIVERSARPNRR